MSKRVTFYFRLRLCLLCYGCCWITSKKINGRSAKVFPAVCTLEYIRLNEPLDFIKRILLANVNFRRYQCTCKLQLVILCWFLTFCSTAYFNKNQRIEKLIQLFMQAKKMQVLPENTNMYYKSSLKKPNCAIQNINISSNQQKYNINLFCHNIF